MFALEAARPALVSADIKHRLKATLDFSNEVRNVSEIHDILAAYYYVARKRFVDNVASLVVERHFLSRDEGGPARCFSPQWVGGLSDDELGMIAVEDNPVSNRRAVLKDKLDRWRAAKKLAEVF